MARFAARHANYSHGIRTGRWMVLSDGQRQETTKHLMAKFRRGILTEEEENVAIASMDHPGLPIDRDTEEHFSPRSRISGFDTLESQEFFGWTDEEREIVETVLRKSPHLNLDFIELEPAAANKPWPQYGDINDPRTIVDLVKLTGLQPSQVIAYERQNANRPEVIEALESIGKEDEDDEVVLIEA